MTLSSISAQCTNERQWNTILNIQKYSEDLNTTLNKIQMRTHYSPILEWPLAEVIATSDSLLAAFVAMLGKMAEHKPGESMIETVPIIHRVSPSYPRSPSSLVACHDVWSLNTSVSHVVVSFTILGIIFYIRIMVTWTSS